MTITEGDSKMADLKAWINNDPRRYVRPGVYAVLYIDGELMMSDTAAEQRAVYGLIHNARGRVLIAGLGLGMCVVPLLKSPRVERVTVIEVCQSVIDLVAPHIDHEKLDVIRADIYTWKPKRGAKYDTIFLDIWPTINADDLPGITKLKRKFTRYKAPGGWLGVWEERRRKFQATMDRR